MINDAAADSIPIGPFDVLDGRVRHGDVVQLSRPNGDRIGPRRVESVAQGGGVYSLLVKDVGDVDLGPGHRLNRGRYLGYLESAGWTVTSIQRGVPEGALPGDTP